jgi:SAM-dependent methyltransferase
MGGESRTADRLRQHYDIEKQLANRLRAASSEERRTLYPQLYDELFTRVPDHPQLTRDERETAADVAAQLSLLKPFLDPTVRFLEIGAGDCALSASVAPLVTRAYAVDVSAEIVQGVPLPDNLEVVLSDGTNIPVPDASIDVAYSNQLMEHLHLDDALVQLRNLYDALAPGGVYLCITPNRLTGPHDISKYFDDVATGFHLREYTIRELRKIFLDTGFHRTAVVIGGRGVYRRTGDGWVRAVESAFACLPPRVRRTLGTRAYAHGLLGVRLIGFK